ncbi:MAG: hypothetical protein H6797_02075 [Candidatus Nomurabacteria bacterium]|nr:MAG: hypothetical protein H6797_02075 [Candidatus Nomurabacteria bacterium]
MGSFCERTSRGVFSGGLDRGRGNALGNTLACSFGVTSGDERLGESAQLLVGVTIARTLALLICLGSFLLFLGHQGLEEVAVTTADGQLVVDFGECRVGYQIASVDECLLCELKLVAGHFVAGLEVIDSTPEIDSILEVGGLLDVPELQVLGGVGLHLLADRLDATCAGNPSRLRLATAGAIDHLGVGHDTPLLAGVLDLR